MTAYTRNSRTTLHWWARARRAPTLVLWLAISAVGCDSLVDVENPNNVKGEDLENPQAASSIVNGALYTVSQGYGYMLMPYSDATDEATWVGSRDAWNELDFGNVSNAFNEFTDAAFPFLAEGRWMADEAIKLLKGFDAAGELATNQTDLARAYLYGAMVYTFIGDMMDDFALSDRRVAAAPIGEGNMGQVYTTAIGYLDQGLAIAVAEADTDLQRDILAWRARAKHALAVWGLVGTRPISTGTVSDAGAVADATAALALDATDWTVEFEYSTSTVWNDVGWQINARLELRLGPTYFIADADGTRVTGTALNDPILGSADPVLTAFLDDFTGGDPSDGDQYPELTVLSAREMWLIIAEDEFRTNGASQVFEDAINEVRDFAKLANYDRTGAVTGLDILKHSRRVNLFLQGRRLADLYRFGDTSPEWQATSDAITAPGTFLPITIIEIRANCHLADFECPSGG